jgi:hypothetical protein
VVWSWFLQIFLHFWYFSIISFLVFNVKLKNRCISQVVLIKVWSIVSRPKQGDIFICIHVFQITRDEGH